MFLAGYVRRSEVIYVEHVKAHRDKLEKAAKLVTDAVAEMDTLGEEAVPRSAGQLSKGENDLDRIVSPVPIEVVMAKSPEEMGDKLDGSIDLVLCDVYFGHRGNKRGEYRLSDILSILKKQVASKKLAWGVPVIAYTGYGAAALRDLLKHEDDLADILDKNHASHEYVAWRLSKIAVETLSRRPGHQLGKQLLAMKRGAPWHGHVLAMVGAYAGGVSERDQIGAVEAEVRRISHQIGIEPVVRALWSSAIEWENVESAVREDMRGHCRHSVNTFWLGYLLIHDDKMKGIFEGLQKKLLSRSGEPSLGEKPSLDVLSACWFATAMLHDVGQLGQGLNHALGTLSKTVARLAPGVADMQGHSFSVSWPPEETKQAVIDIITADGLPAKEYLTQQWEKSFSDRVPDHGLYGAWCVSATFEKTDCQSEKGYSKPEVTAMVKEAVRAIALHNHVGSTDNVADFPPLKWKDEPLACLLVLCDQLQAWDRDKVEKRGAADTWPERAELLRISVDPIDGGRSVCVKLAVNYVLPQRFHQDPMGTAALRAELEKVLADHPKRAIYNISEPWPFRLEVDFYLAGKKLDERIIRRAPTCT